LAGRRAISAALRYALLIEPAREEHKIANRHSFPISGTVRSFLHRAIYRERIVSA